MFPLLAFHIILLFIALVTFVAVEGSSAQRKPQTAFLSYTSWSQTTDSSIRDAMERI